MNPQQKKMGSRAYLAYILGACVLGAGIFFYELYLNSAPLLTVTPAPSVSSTIFATSSPLSLIVVRTQADQERGLGGRSLLSADTGMLFVFEHPSNYGIWMKDMEFSIDIISLDSHFSVTHIESNVSPATYPTIFYSPTTTKYIIETNAGYAQKNNIKVGDVIDAAQKAVNN